jgi:hypothetical protein
MVKFLLEKGADVNVRNNDGETPLHEAFLAAESYESEDGRDPDEAEKARAKAELIKQHGGVE